MTSEVTMALRIRVRPDFATTIARADITRTALADASNVSPRTVDSLANPGGYGRKGYAREITAWRIARGFAKLTAQTEEQAFERLFTQEAGGDR